MKKKYEKISKIEVVEELKYLGMVVQVMINVFKGQKNEMIKKIEHDGKLCHRKKNLPSSNDGKTHWTGMVLSSTLWGAGEIEMKEEEKDKLQKKKKQRTLQWEKS